MKILTWSLTAIVSLAPSSVILAENEEEATGTVVQVQGGRMEMDIGKGYEHFVIFLSADCEPPKIGEKVKVHYEWLGGVDRLATRSQRPVPARKALKGGEDEGQLFCGAFRGFC